MKYLLFFFLLVVTISCNNSEVEESTFIVEDPEVFTFSYLYEDIKVNGLNVPSDSVKFGYTFYSSFDLDYESMISIDTLCDQLIRIDLRLVRGYTDMIDSVYLYQRVVDSNGQGFEEFVKARYDTEIYYWTILNANETCNPY